MEADEIIFSKAQQWFFHVIYTGESRVCTSLVHRICELEAVSANALVRVGAREMVCVE